MRIMHRTRQATSGLLPAEQYLACDTSIDTAPTIFGKRKPSYALPAKHQRHVLRHGPLLVRFRP